MMKDNLSDSFWKLTKAGENEKSSIHIQLRKEYFQKKINKISLKFSKYFNDDKNVFVFVFYLLFNF